VPDAHREVFHKASASAPPGYFTWEAAGLAWLDDAASASGGVSAAEVVDVGAHHLDLVWITPTSASPDAAESFGRHLARTHLAGAPAYGSPPPGWKGDGFLGPLVELLPLQLRPTDTWGPFYAEQRILATLALGRDRAVYDDSDVAVFEAVAKRVASGEFDNGGPPWRLHGDLWAGNILWTRKGGVLIDPASHGGHREADLGMLALFGCAHLDRIIGAYQEVSQLDSGWLARRPLHQLHPLMVHAVLFGGGYIAQSLAAARRFA
jgi:fructosamine-3-kinase